MTFWDCELICNQNLRARTMQIVCGRRLRRHARIVSVTISELICQGFVLPHGFREKERDETKRSLTGVEDMARGGEPETAVAMFVLPSFSGIFLHGLRFVEECRAFFSYKEPMPFANLACDLFFMEGSGNAKGDRDRDRDRLSMASHGSRRQSVDNNSNPSSSSPAYFGAESCLLLLLLAVSLLILPLVLPPLPPPPSMLLLLPVGLLGVLFILAFMPSVDVL
ncbi:uncharacterized protein LOC122020132 isoform X1 [Zingiber officinale]|uniref:uncharacterized protein LOC122020132 isoform X1 n=1 Tax=Zingiber officinale TaxID=94328 RepID=UPI001C4CCFBE|nr:uncharacterized protein LOC122020132 isoform X1 [Zingiber officinale]XP_042433836.1 uncharacterized protein LOC122020132 isoform X1 [Zingiber officinale]XP_042433837.1 uncharacterized protein LOC122020132 isoform X1 [Zingiber officinale]XP_042433838.1 uncharacterized protein LOC122020132 isoform X1 [Zingiber officinale]XP_042433839.1 uncharacterized protein LOC122020132 isoform X1 [Zingiber officinale]XP_042433840.1 uncharacterized protein LOC122020132 isoform X1 [Zingiber officinale]XP_04